jgi:hypothetical protein
VAAGVFSVLALQKSVVRSGWGHLSTCLLPAIALAGAVLLSFRREDEDSVWSHAPAWIAVLLTLVFSGPNSLFTPFSVWQRVQWREPAFLGCPASLYYFDEMCLSAADFRKLNSVSSYVRRTTAGSESIMVFPYENIYGPAARRHVAGGVLQSYLATGEELTRQHLLALEKDRPSLAIYSMDELVSWPMDGVASFTRTPQIWSYLAANYGMETELQPGVLILRRLPDSVPRPHFRITECPIPSSSPRTSNGNSLRVEPLAIPGSQADFVRVRLKIAYPWYWRLLKPSRARLDIAFGDGTRKSFPFVAEPGKAVDIWIHPWGIANFREYFVRGPKLAEERRSRPDLTGITLAHAPLDWTSVRPSALAVEKVDAVLQAGF